MGAPSANAGLLIVNGPPAGAAFVMPAVSRVGTDEGVRVLPPPP
ncbi:hypothetical protein I546_5395 [Mycobacterium kansasii 732]|nr:hypothetical protein I546_5395 [Mycobacterium kansasii 732]